MKLQFLSAAAAAAVSLSFASAALAGPALTVTLQEPVAEKTKLIAGGAVFHCVDSQCVAAAPTSRTYATNACKEIAKTVGAVESFGDGRKQFDADKLGQCNAAAAPATQVANR